MYYRRVTMVKIEQVAEFRSCLTCVHRRPYPCAVKNGEPVYYRFLCGMSLDSGKDLVKPEEVCDFWNKATLHSD
jgi:hypothetical protein